MRKALRRARKGILVLVLGANGVVWTAAGLHWALTRQVVLMSAISPDNKFVCTLVAPWNDETDTTAYIRDTQGKILPRGVWRPSQGVFLTSAEWQGDECRLYINSSTGGYIGAICHGGKVVWMPPQSDEDLAQLDGCESVNSLEINSMGISDKGISHLFNCPNLNVIMLNKSRVTRDAMVALKQKHPAVKVYDVANTPPGKAFTLMDLDPARPAATPSPRP